MSKYNLVADNFPLFLWIVSISILVIISIGGVIDELGSFDKSYAIICLTLMFICMSIVVIRCNSNNKCKEVNE